MTRRTHLLPVILCLLFVSLVIGLDTEPGFAEMKAPEIALPGLEWFNVAAPLPIASLHGRVVILDFWTEGCINCIQIIPTLRRIEEQFPDKVVVIGVHSPKFANEKNAASVKDAIRRYDIHHPIIHDPQMTIWRAYGVQAWPTAVRNWMPVSHSAGVSRVWTANSCRWPMRAASSSRSRGPGVPE